MEVEQTIAIASFIERWCSYRVQAMTRKGKENKNWIRLRKAWTSIEECSIEAVLRAQSNTHCCPDIRARGCWVPLSTHLYTMTGPNPLCGSSTASDLPLRQVNAHLEAIPVWQRRVLKAVSRCAQERQEVFVAFSARDGVVSKDDSAVPQVWQDGLQRSKRER